MIYIDSDVLNAFMNFANQKTVIRIEKGDERIVVQDNSMSFYLVAMVNGSLEYVGSEAYPTITQNDVIANGLSINRYVSNPNGIGFGSVVPAELNVTFNNAEGKYDSSIFEDAEITVEIMVEGFEDRPVKFGRYIVDEVRYSGTNIELTAFDRLILMDVIADLSSITLPTTAAGLIGHVCGACGITISSDVTLANLPNADYVISKLPDGDYTYRQYLKWLLELCGSNAMMNEKDELYIGWYSWGMFPMTELTPQNRFSSTRAEKQLSLNCVTVANALTGNVATSTEYAPGGYAISVSGNPFITHDEQTVADNICTPIGGYSWYPFEAATVPIPSLMPMDRIGFTDKAGNTVYTMVSDVTFSLGQNTQVAGKGETAAYKRRVTNNYNSTEQYLASRIDNAYVPGTDTLNGQQLANNSVTHEKINVLDLFAQHLTASYFDITGGSVHINTDSGSIDVISLEYDDPTNGLFSTAMSSTAFSVSGFGGAKSGYYGSEYCELSDANYEGSLFPEKVLFYDKTASNEAACFQAALPNVYGDGTILQASFDDSPNSGTVWETGMFRPATDLDLNLGSAHQKWKNVFAYGANIDKIACKDFTNIYHDKHSITVTGGQGNGFSLSVPISKVGDDPIVQITCDNIYLGTSFTITRAGASVVIVITVLNGDSSSQTGNVYTTLFYNSST